MEIIFYNTQSDDRVINKTLVLGEQLNGEMRGECSIMQPVVRVAVDHEIRYNYCYIPRFQRYYSITETSAYRTGLWEVSMDCDVLMSFRGDILNFNAVVERQTDEENGNQYIDDGSLVAESRMTTEVMLFSRGFNETAQYVLITAG